MKELFEKINQKKTELDKQRPLPSHTLKSLREKLFLDWTYHSNAIEGNTLTLQETKVVLEGITIGGKSIREHLEVVNHQEAIYYLEEIIRNGEPLSETQIKNIHQLVLKGIDDQNAGKYRDQKVLISGAEHTPPEPVAVPGDMQNFMDWYHKEGVKLHPVERAAMVHGIFVKIHPFIDGNGRTARLLMNFELMKEGYPPTIIRNEYRVQYYSALDHAHTTGDYERFIEMVAGEVERSLDLFLEFLT